MGSRSGMVGPLAGFASGFASELVARGYRPRSAAAQLALMADVNEWLAGGRLGPGDVSEELVDRLIAELRRSGRARLCSPRALSPLLEYLRGLGVAPLERPPVPVTATDVMIARYSSYLCERRGDAVDRS